MKFYFALLLITFLSVSCGNKNKSGGSDSNRDSGWETLEDTEFTNNSYQVEQQISQAYLKALRSEFKIHQEKIRRKVGSKNFQTIKSRLAHLQIRTEYRVMLEPRSRQVVSSYFDGLSMTIYIGLEEKGHSWRYLLQKRNARSNELLYNDLLQLRMIDSFMYDDYNMHMPYKKGFKRSYYFEFRTR